ncbi:MAG: high-potential iron-sulfur protein [Chromatiaceae bacterium]|jgi:hypothetical protein
MKDINRRGFLGRIVVGAIGIATLPVVIAEEKKEHLTEDDPYAKSMGFVTDTTRANSKRYKKHSVDQSCSNCQLYKGEAESAEGPCSFFGHRIVPSTGWCRNYKPVKA